MSVFDLFGSQMNHINNGFREIHLKGILEVEKV